MKRIWERLYIKCLADAEAEPIEISPGPDLFEVRFEFDRQLGISVILPATCALSVQLKAWELLPEYKRRASSTSVCSISIATGSIHTGTACQIPRNETGHL
jgi:hypothetical protein